jgi:hypothetical protein
MVMAACYNDRMNPADVSLYHQRWLAVEDSERQELRSASIYEWHFS